MIVDTSAWIEFLRGTGSPTHLRLRALVEAEADLIVPELVVMELCIGPTDERDARRLRRLLHSFDVVPLAPLIDADRAAALHRQCRRAGQTVRSLVDCLISALALRLDEQVLHCDRDFEVLARHAGLRVTTG